MNNKYLLLENQIKSGSLPPDLAEFISTYGEMDTTAKLTKAHKTFLATLKKHVFDQGDPQYTKTIAYMKKLNLSWLWSYGDGDYAFYSPKTKKVYNWGHEGFGFGELNSTTDPYYLTSFPYKVWMKRLLAGQNDITSGTKPGTYPLKNRS